MSFARADDRVEQKRWRTRELAAAELFFGEAGLQRILAAETSRIVRNFAEHAIDGDAGDQRVV